MKIIDLKTFRKMPEGTIFSKYEPCCFEGLMVKDETTEHDFYYLDLIGNVEASDTGEFSVKCYAAQEEGINIKLDFETIERDGLYEQNQLFAVYEKEDVEALINRLKEAHNQALDADKRIKPSQPFCENPECPLSKIPVPPDKPHCIKTPAGLIFRNCFIAEVSKAQIWLCDNCGDEYGFLSSLEL